MSQVTIKVRDHGPLLVEGPFTVIDAAGNAFTIPAGKPAIALCRCGQSKNKPFCDGTHRECGFMAAERACLRRRQPYARQHCSDSDFCLFATASRQVIPTASVRIGCTQLCTVAMTFDPRPGKHFQDASPAIVEPPAWAGCL